MLRVKSSSLVIRNQQIMRKRWVSGNDSISTYGRDQQSNGPQGRPDPGTCDYGALCDKRDFADVTKFTTLRWGDDPGSSQWAQCNHKGS